MNTSTNTTATTSTNTNNTSATISLEMQDAPIKFNLMRENNMIKITLETIHSNDPCYDDWRIVSEVNGNEPFPVSSILDSNGLDDTLWVLRCLPEHNQLWRKFACWCALESIELIKPYTDQYELIVKNLNEPNIGDVDATDAANAVYANAASNAYDNDDAYATNAAYAASATTYADDARAAYAAADAASDATSFNIKQKQADKLRQILDAGEWVE